MKAMMLTCATPMPTEQAMCANANTKMRRPAAASTGSPICSTGYGRIRAFTLTELVVVLLIISLFVLLAVMNLCQLLRRSTFRAQVHDFVTTMQMAATAAAQSDRRYEVIVDLTEQRYVLREITVPDLTQVLEEEIIVNDAFGDTYYVAYVLFDDGDYTNEGRAKFRAGHSGWQYGGKIVLRDEYERDYSVVVNRLSGVVKLRNGDVELLEPRSSTDVVF